MTSVAQSSFAKGEVAPALYSRVDTAAYAIALRKARNVLIHPTGGASNRPGLEFLGPAKIYDEDLPGRLIPFRFKATDAYILEFGDQYMRVLRNGAHVLEAPRTVTAVSQADPAVVTAPAHGFAAGDEVYIESVAGMTEINRRRFLVGTVLSANQFELFDNFLNDDLDSTGFTAYTSGGTVARVYTLETPYAAADLARLKYTQDADIMTLTHASYDPLELQRFDHNNWVLATVITQPKTPFPTGIIVTAGRIGGERQRYTVTALAKDESIQGVNDTAKTISGATLTDPVVISCTSHGFVTGDEVHIRDVLGMTELNERRFLIDKIDANSFSLRGEDGTGYTAYSSAGSAARTFGEVRLDNITNITKANPAVVTTGTRHGFQNDQEVQIGGVVGMTEVNNRRFIVKNKTAFTFELYQEDSSGYAAYSSGGSVWLPNDIINTITWDVMPDTDTYQVYREVNGQYAFVGETRLNTFVDNNERLDTTIGPPQQANPFRGDEDKPGAVGFFQQRRVFGGSTNEPDTSRYSKIGSYGNFSVSIPSRADDPITAVLPVTEVNEIRHYVPLTDLLVLTGGAEVRVNGSEDSGFTAATLKQKPQTFWGASHIRPVVIGNVIMFSEGDGDVGHTLRSIGFSFQVDGYTGSDMNILAKHLISTSMTVVDMAFAKSPDPIVYMVRSDGKLLTMTFHAEQEVVAWTLCETKGKILSVASLQNDLDGVDAGVYFLVQRKINGRSVRYIERLHSRRFETPEDCFFVDCGASLDSPITITGITSADPVVVTAPGHGLSNGDQIDFSDIEWEPEVDEITYAETQPSQLRDRYLVANATADTFELQTLSEVDVDGTGFNAYSSGGYVRKAVETVTGLWHLEGASVVVLADGNVVNGLTVAGGTITLPRRASRVHIGSRYTALVETLDIEIPQSGGSQQGKRKKVSKVIGKFERTRGIFLGPNMDDLDYMKTRDQEAIGEPTRLLTGTKEIPVASLWNDNGRVSIWQRDPLPFTVLGLVPDFIAEDA